MQVILPEHYINWSGIVPEPWTPAKLFTEGEQGLIYDPSDFSTMFQDAAGTIPVTGVGQPVGLVLDKSGNGNHASQVTETARPVLGREPVGGRKNLLDYSEDFTNSKWIKSVSSVVLAPEESPPFGTAHKHVEAADSTGAKILSQSTPVLTEGVRYTSFRVVKAGERTRIRGQLFRVSPIAQTDFNLVTGEVIGSSYGEGGIVDLGAGWYLCWISGVAAESNFYTDRFYPMEGTSTGYPGVEGSGYYIAAAQNTEGSEVLPYQKVLSQYDTTEEGVPDIYGLYFDGVDDRLVTEGIDFTSTDKMSVFAGVRKSSDAAIGVVAELANINNVDGSFNLLAPSGNGLANYSYRSKGTVQVQPNTSSIFPAPTTNVLTGYSDISAPLVGLRVDGIQRSVSAASQGDGAYGNFSLNIGARSGGTLFFSGNIYSLIVRGASTSQEDLEQTEQWVAEKSGVSL